MRTQWCLRLDADDVGAEECVTIVGLYAVKQAEKMKIRPGAVAQPAGPAAALTLQPAAGKWSVKCVHSIYSIAVF